LQNGRNCVQNILGSSACPHRLWAQQNKRAYLGSTLGCETKRVQERRIPPCLSSPFCSRHLLTLASTCHSASATLILLPAAQMPHTVHQSPLSSLSPDDVLAHHVLCSTSLKHMHRPPHINHGIAASSRSYSSALRNPSALRLSITDYL
jgi:hypothetical protein